MLFLGCNKDDLSYDKDDVDLIEIGSTPFYNQQPKSLLVSSEKDVIAIYHSDGLHIKQFNSNGILINQTSDSRIKFGYCINQSNDNGYIISGETKNKRACLLKVDSNLNIQWYKTYNFNNVECFGKTVIQNQDEGYLLLVYKNIEDYRLIKTNSKGDTLWTKKYNSWTMDLASVGLRSLKILDVKVKDDKIILIGNCIIQTDTNGNVELFKNLYPEISNDGVIESSFQMIDESIYCLGELGGSIYLNKLSFEGNILWNKSVLTGYNTESTNFEKTSDNSFVFGANDYSLDQYQSRIFKLNQEGDTLWSFQPKVNDQYERVISIKQLDNNSYVSMFSIIGDDPSDPTLKKLVLYLFER